MIFRNDNSITESLVSIYTSKYIRDIPNSDYIKFSEFNRFLKKIYGDKKYLISMHVPEIDYETAIVASGGRYIFDRWQDDKRKLILFNVIEYDGKEYVVGERRRFY